MITGNPGTRNVQIDGKRLDPAVSQEVHNHSPDGFAWGYSGSGPAQLALAILLHFASRPFALRYYQDFKSEVIAEQSMYNDLHISNNVVHDFIERKRDDQSA